MATPVVLCIGGFSPDAGAGVLADVKTCHENSCYAVAAVTVNTAQSHISFATASPVDFEIFSQQLKELSSAYQIAAVKVGAIYNKEQLELIIRTAIQLKVSTVIDPVGSASLGGKLSELTPAEFLTGLDVLPTTLQQQSLLTPNIPELLVLTGQLERGATVANIESKDLARAGTRLAEQTGFNVLVKGGHTDSADDILCTLDNQSFKLQGNRQHEINSHGSGCRYASAIASGFAHSYDIVSAVTRAKTWLDEKFSKPMQLTDPHYKHFGILGP